MNPGETLFGFEVQRVVPIERMKITAINLTHSASGARLLHLAADDPENMFAVALRTPPPDDTGLPHILEHSVLNGSQRYPVRDPFVELLKTSMATFLNAMTYNDRTVYPCSSMNPKDFHNLMRVYADAVFFPNLTRDTFLQEGHHTELPDGLPAIIKGVVYNEMKGVYSDPNSLLFRQLTQKLFESNAYGLDYGGDPDVIPSLTYEQFVAFHKKYYHPSNAFIFTYGNVPLQSTLKILDEEYLCRFTAMDITTTIAPLIRWTAPQNMVRPYPIGQDDDPAGKTDIALMWAANDSRDTLQTLAMMVIDQYFLDNAASPLRKALIDSKLGEEVGSSGYGDYQRDTFFMVSLKGSEPDRAQAMEDTVMRVLREECERGFDKERTAAALHRMELGSREIKSEYPIQLMERVFGAWIYDTDPLAYIQADMRMDELRDSIAEQPRYLEDTARRWLIDNPHRLRITQIPDKNIQAARERESSDALQRRVSSLEPQQLQDIRDTADRLAQIQQAGNSPEALATLPRLALKDVNPEPIPLYSESCTEQGRTFIRVPMFACGLTYFNLSLGLDKMSDDDLDLLPLLCDAISKSGAAGKSYDVMASREAAVTGALDFEPSFIPHVDGGHKTSLRLSVWLKALDSDCEQALAVMSDRLFSADFDDTARLRDIVLQSRMAWRNQVVPAGDYYSLLRAGRGNNPTCAMLERLRGCTQGRFVNRLANAIDRELMTLPDRLRDLRDRLLAGSGCIASQIGSDNSVRLGRAWMHANSSRFGRPGDGSTPVGDAADGLGSERIGIAAPADIAYCAMPLTAPSINHPDAAALLLLAAQLSYGYLWNEIRVKGGAYGAHGRYDSTRGLFTLSTYRDPNIASSLRAFAGVAEHVERDMDLSPAGLEQAIIGTFKRLDRPLRPAVAVTGALQRTVGAETDDFRRLIRSRVLGLDADTIRRVAHEVFGAVDKAPVCVLAGRDKLTKENQKLAQPLAVESLWEE